MPGSESEWGSAKSALERLIQLQIIKSEDEPRARSEMDRLIAQPAPASGSEAREAAARALLEAGIVTEYQAEQIENDQIDRLRCGSYALLEEIGEGGMGAVFKARHIVLNRIDALKTIQGPLRKDRELTARFRREAELLARIEHPNVVRAHHAEIDPKRDLHYLAMEYIDGSNLQALVNRLRRQSLRLGFREIRSYVLDAARGLARIHEEGIVHRDVKPSNLMLKPDGAVKVLDMGLARFCDAAPGGGGSITKAGQMLGSPAYMAPEQCGNAKHADRRADIYSLGCSLFFLCAGETVFQKVCGKSDACHINAHLNLEPPRIRDLRPDAPDEWDAIFRRMTAKAPADRFSTMLEVIQAFERPEAIPAAIEAGPSPSPSSGPEPIAPFPVVAPAEVDRDRDRIGEGRSAGASRCDNRMKAEMIWCPPGEFPMGSPKNEPDRCDDEAPRRVVVPRGFWIGKHPVIQKDWFDVMGTTIREQALKRSPKLSQSLWGESPFHPMYYVSYDEAIEFCRRLTDQERRDGRLPDGWEYRLPTEARWEYACRAGTATATAFGDSLSSKQANFNGEYPYNGAEKGVFLGQTEEIGRYPANPWGIHDMHGNVWEWCEREPSLISPPESPFLPKRAERAAPRRSVRGGGWNGYGRGCRSASRSQAAPGYRDRDLGFRIILDAVEPSTADRIATPAD